MTPRSILGLFSRVAAERDIFAPEGAAHLTSLPEAAALAQEMSACPPDELVVSVLRAIALERDELERNAVDLDFVATLPGFSSSVARSTEEAVGALLDQAKHQVIAVGYEITEAGFVDRLHRFAGRGGQVVLVTDRRSGHGPRLLAGWPSYLPPPHVFQERAPLVHEKSKMHGKALLVDGERLFVSSANFTWLGMNANIELGVIVSGPRVRPARDLFEELLLHSGLLERVHA